MRLALKKILLMFFILYNSSFPVSFVYNFKIAQITKQPVLEDKNNMNYIAMILLLGEYHTKYDCTKQQFNGVLWSYIQEFYNNFFRIDFAQSHVKEIKNNVVTLSENDTDDMVFTFGHSFKINDYSITTLSVLGGVPTHRIERLQRVTFGEGQGGIGVQLDGSYNLSDRTNFLWGTRYIYFFPGPALDIDCKEHIFTIGNVGDLLFAVNKWWNKKYGLEIGYAARWQFGARIYPYLENIICKTNYSRNSFYIVCKYKFKTDHFAHRLLLDITNGFDSKPKDYGNKHILTVWLSYSLGF